MVAEGQVARIVEFIEKPDEPQTLDSDLMAVGRYVLSADIWAELERTEPGARGRIQLTDAIAELAKKQSVDAMLMTGESYDCGKKMGYMQAFVTYGMRNLKEGAKFRESIKNCWPERQPETERQDLNIRPAAHNVMQNLFIT